MSRFVNLGILSHPLNWATVLVWIIALGYVIHVCDPVLKTFYPVNGVDR